MDGLLAKMTQLGVVWGGASLPVEFRKDETTFQADLKELPRSRRRVQKGRWISHGNLHHSRLMMN